MENSSYCSRFSQNPFGTPSEAIFFPLNHFQNSQLLLDRGRNHVVICYLTLSHQPGHSTLPSHLRVSPPSLLTFRCELSTSYSSTFRCARRLPRLPAPTSLGPRASRGPGPGVARASSFTSFTSFASSTTPKSFTIRTSMTPLPQLLYNPHLQAPLASAGNKGLITPLESALTRNSPVTSLESALTKTPGGTPSGDDFSSWYCHALVPGEVGGRLCPAARPETPTTPLWPRPCYHSPAAPNPRLFLPDRRSP